MLTVYAYALYIIYPHNTRHTGSESLNIMLAKEAEILCFFFIVQGHFKVKFFYQNIVFGHRLHIISIKKNHHGTLDILISVHF